MLGFGVGFDEPLGKVRQIARAIGAGNHPEYKPFGEARQEGSVSRFHVINDTDLARAIPYLPAAG